jgi:glycine hydroxymethyltransferase
MVTKKGIEKDAEIVSKLDKAVFPGLQGGPHENIIAAKAIAFREAMSREFREYAEQIVKNSKVLAETLKELGIKLVSNGTDNHLILVDLTNYGVGLGKNVAVALEEAGIVSNANSIPNDPSTPFKPSGLRLGTPMITTRGMKENEMRKIGLWISQVIKEPANALLKENIKEQVENLCRKFPIDLS